MGVNMLKKQIYILMAVVLVLGMAGSAWAVSSKVGYIDLQRLVKESKLGKAAMSDIERLRTEKQKAIAEKLKLINTIKIDLESKDELLKGEKKKDKLEELNSLIRDYKRMVDDAKEEIAKEDRELVAQILKKADGLLKKVSKKEKFTMILKDPNAVGYLDPSVDITDQVLKELNKN